MSVLSTNSYEDEESRSSTRPHRRRRSHRCCSAIAFCIILLLLLVVVVVVVVVALAFTVFKAREPSIHVDDIHLQRFNVSARRSGLLSFSVSANITLAIAMSVYNPNRASFRYTDSAAQVYYHGQEVAMVPIPSGTIGSLASENISTSLDLYADKLLLNSNLFDDFTAGSLPFATSTNLSGRVKALGFIKRHVDISARCNITIAVTSASVQDMECENSFTL